MPQWTNSTRRDRLPADWPLRRKRILRRDKYRCQHRYPSGSRCGRYATDVDHIIPNDDDSETNLQALCSEHHQVKSSSEGGSAAAAKKKEIHQRFRRREDHPGLRR